MNLTQGHRLDRNAFGVEARRAVGASAEDFTAVTLTGGGSLDTLHRVSTTAPRWPIAFRRARPAR